MTSLSSATPRITDDVIAEAHRKAHHLRAQALQAMGAAVGRAFTRTLAYAAGWLRRRLAGAPSLSPWLRHRF